MATRKKSTPKKQESWWRPIFSLATDVIMSDTKMIIRSAEDRVRTFVQMTIIRSLLLFLGFIGIILLLIGANQVLDGFFHMAGAGSLLLGSLVLLVSLIAFLLMDKGEK